MTKNNEILERVERLENYNTLNNINDLFCITTDLIEKCSSEIESKEYEDAKTSLNQAMSMISVLWDKFPKSHFEDIEMLTTYLKTEKLSSN